MLTFLMLLIIGCFLCLFRVAMGNVAIAWALLAFIGTLALAKYLEGRGFDE